MDRDVPTDSDSRSRATGSDGAPRERPAAVVPARAARGLQLPPVRPIGDHNWLGSSFDLAQGLEVKEMMSKLSPETLDQLFRS